jgi:hypothetical protein
MSVVYLAGPINGRTDSEAYDWREYAASRLPRTISPMARDYRGKEAENVAEIVDGDKEDIRHSDVVLAYCWTPSVDTSMEISYAHGLGIPIVVVVPEQVPVSPWLTYHAEYITHLLGDAIDHILAEYPR